MSHLQGPTPQELVEGVAALESQQSRITELERVLRIVIAGYRTFRNVPKDRQEWTPLDDEALEAALEALRGAPNGKSQGVC